ncbi:hypothetical protein CEUSTIGMA_g9738.t1 [Chlamydomonas eustigma]|uniref:Uncharacterized protein n=1 Tax=Chlamydomonas eustigma TaxID=1157962 RepID=A0A250XHB4_9CHLO|nr:hypothetical protein CEUSTIGMA_g9738.t1 [Chlamydomonas eustigma]|eukprot:GAX82309.1 hypothetical protein CEUSTIGMA_g9738.t1 [Chlamydomonas eustigma]
MSAPILNHSVIQDHILDGIDGVEGNRYMTSPESHLISKCPAPGLGSSDQYGHEQSIMALRDEEYPGKHIASVVSSLSRFSVRSADTASQELLSYLSTDPAGKPSMSSFKTASRLSAEDLREHRIQVSLDFMSLSQDHPQLSEMLVNKTGIPGFGYARGHRGHNKAPDRSNASRCVGGGATFSRDDDGDRVTEDMAQRVLIPACHLWLSDMCSATLQPRKHRGKVGSGAVLVKLLDDLVTDDRFQVGDIVHVIGHVSIGPLLSNTCVSTACGPSVNTAPVDGKFLNRHQLPQDAWCSTDDALLPYAHRPVAVSNSFWSTRASTSLQVEALYCRKVPCKGGHAIWGLPPSLCQQSGSSSRAAPANTLLPARPDLQDLCTCLNKVVGMPVSLDLSLALLLSAAASASISAHESSQEAAIQSAHAGHQGVLLDFSVKVCGEAGIASRSSQICLHISQAGSNDPALVNRILKVSAAALSPHSIFFSAAAADDPVIPCITKNTIPLNSGRQSNVRVLGASTLTMCNRGILVVDADAITPEHAMKTYRILGESLLHRQALIPAGNKSGFNTSRPLLLQPTNRGMKSKPGTAASADGFNGRKSLYTEGFSGAVLPCIADSTDCPVTTTATVWAATHSKSLTVGGCAGDQAGSERSNDGVKKTSKSSFMRRGNYPPLPSTGFDLVLQFECSEEVMMDQVLHNNKPDVEDDNDLNNYGITSGELLTLNAGTFSHPPQQQQAAAAVAALRCHMYSVALQSLSSTELEKLDGHFNSSDYPRLHSHSMLCPQTASACGSGDHKMATGGRGVTDHSFEKGCWAAGFTPMALAMLQAYVMSVRQALGAGLQLISHAELSILLTKLSRGCAQLLLKGQNVGLHPECTVAILLTELTIRNRFGSSYVNARVPQQLFSLSAEATVSDQLISLHQALELTLQMPSTPR